MGRAPVKSCLVPIFFMGVLKPNFQQSVNLPVEIVSL